MRRLHEQAGVRLVNGNLVGLLGRREAELAGCPGRQDVNGLVPDDVAHLRVHDSAPVQEERAPLVVPRELELAGLSGCREELDDVGELELAE
jgi:hypothetical protein